MAHTHSVMDNPGQVAGIVAVSALIGALAAMLFTPKSGEESRAALKRQAGHMKDRVRHSAGDAKDTLQETAKQAKDSASDTVEHIRKHGEK